MLEYDRIDISEGINLNKTSASKECVTIGICNGCHDLMQKAMSFNDVEIVYVNGSAYRIHFLHVSKDDAINIMNNSNWIDKKGVL